VDAAKNQVKGQMVLDLEDPGMRLMRLGTRALFDEKITGLNEGLAKVDAVSAHDVFAMAQDLLTAPAIDVAVGPAEVKL
jgi:predicted Zn-dependent peptidase